MSTTNVIKMSSQEEKEYLKSIFLRLLPKFSNVVIPSIVSKEFEHIIDKTVNSIYDIINKDLTNDDFIKKLYKVDWFKYFDKINEEVNFRQIQPSKVLN